MLDMLIDRMVAWRGARRRRRWAAEHDAAQAKADAGTCKDDELIYAAFGRCPCGAGMAYPKGIGGHGFWDCSDLLTGRARSNYGGPRHTERLPFTFWEIKSDQQPSANGATTRKRAGDG